MIALAMLAIGLSGTFTFPGGTIDDLVSSLHKQLGRSVVAGVYEPDAVPKFSCAGDLKSVAMKLASRAPFELIDCRTCLALAPTRLPSYAADFHGYLRYAAARRAPKSRPLKLDAGFVDGSTNKGEIVRCLSLIGYNWTAPLRIHWLYEKYGLLFSVVHARQSDLLDAIARCVGAKEIESNTSITFDFDPKAFRKHYAACLQDPTLKYEDSATESGELGRLTDQLTGAVLDSVSDVFLVDCFNHRNRYVYVPFEPHSRVDELARARIAELASMYDRKPLKSTQFGQGISSLLDMADLSKPFHVEYCPAAVVGIGLAVKNGPGQILL